MEMVSSTGSGYCRAGNPTAATDPPLRGRRSRASATTGVVAGLSDQVVIALAGLGDAPALAELRSQWSAGVGADAVFEQRMRDWLAAEGDRRSAWLAKVGETPVGMASIFEYRRMPHPGRAESRWGYISNMFVRVEARGRGIGSALLQELISTADARGYARLVLSPSQMALGLYERAGFTWADQRADGDRLLVRPGTPGPPS